MRRFLLFLAVLTVALATQAAPAWAAVSSAQATSARAAAPLASLAPLWRAAASAAPLWQTAAPAAPLASLWAARATLPYATRKTGALAAPSCVSAAAATYRHSFDGAGGTITITSTAQLCAGQSQTFTLASYTSSASGRFRYAQDSGRLTRTNRSLTLNVDVPACTTAVAAIRGAAPPEEIVSPGPPTSVLGADDDPAWFTGGSGDCTPGARVTFTNACDGTFTATLSNPASSRATAVFRSGTRLLRVPPGNTTTLKARSGTTLTIRSPNFTTYVGTWRQPPTGCTSATPTTPTTNTPPRPPLASVPAAPLPSLSPATSTSPADAAAPPAPPPGAALPTTPSTLNADEKAASTTDHMSTGSIIAILIGLAMIGGGGIALTYLIRELRKPA